MTGEQSKDNIEFFIYKMVKKLLKITYILVKNHSMNYLDVKEMTKLEMDGPKMAKKLKNVPAQFSELRSKNHSNPSPNIFNIQQHSPWNKKKMPA